MRKRELGKEKYKMFSVKRERTPGKVVLESSPVLKETKNLKKKKYLLLNGIKEVVTSGQDPTKFSF